MGKKNKTKKLSKNPIFLKNKNKHRKNKKLKNNSTENGSNNNNININNNSSNKSKQKSKIKKKLKKLRRKNKFNIYKEDDILNEELLNELLMDEEDYEKLPHDKFTQYLTPNTVAENEEYIQELINDSDIILEILDARDILHSSNKNIETLINNKENKLLIYVINKCDLVSEDYIKKIETDIFKKYNKNNFIITSSIIREKINNFFEELKKHIEIYKKEKQLNENDKKIIKIGIIGYPNIGKTSIIQSLELIINSNCEEKYIYFDEEKSFCVNSVPAEIFDMDLNNSFLISKKNKNVNDINEDEAKNILKNLFDVIQKEKLGKLYELESLPNCLEEFIELVSKKYEIDKGIAVKQILKDIISGKINYEVNVFDAFNLI